MPCTLFGGIAKDDNDTAAKWRASCEAEGKVPVRGPEFRSGGKTYFTACCCDSADEKCSKLRLELSARQLETLARRGRVRVRARDLPLEVRLIAE